VRGVHDQQVDARLDQRRDALVGPFADPDRRADPQLAEIVLTERSDARSI
jgi:hypothetical protein